MEVSGLISIPNSLLIFEFGFEIFELFFETLSVSHIHDVAKLSGVHDGVILRFGGERED